MSPSWRQPFSRMAKQHPVVQNVPQGHPELPIKPVLRTSSSSPTPKPQNPFPLRIQSIVNRERVIVSSLLLDSEDLPRLIRFDCFFLLFALDRCSIEWVELLRVERYLFYFKGTSIFGLTLSLRFGFSFIICFSFLKQLLSRLNLRQEGLNFRDSILKRDKFTTRR